MVKPIFIIRIPNFAGMENIDKIKKSVKLKFEDYHVLAVIDSDIEEFKFEVFYEKDFNEVKFEELKQIIKDSVNHADKE